MLFEVSWLIDKRVLYIRIQGDLELDELKRQIEASRALRSQGISPVHVILDARQIGKIPVAPDKLKQMSIKEESDGWKIVLTNSAILRFAASLMTHLVGIEYRFLETPEAALDYLYQLEPALKELELNGVVQQHNHQLP